MARVTGDVEELVLEALFRGLSHTAAASAAGVSAKGSVALFDRVAR